MPEVPQQEPFLPADAELDEAVAELLVEVPGLGVERQRLLGPVEVDIGVDQVEAGREQQMRISLMIDERNRAIENVHGAFRLAGVESRDRLLDQGAGQHVSLAEITVDLARRLGEGNRGFESA